ncbi:MAG TPA: POTRA domain-containing protein [Alphaproteobacteria bacterium]|nr:POTRA domain-containing protein [Alphaproteobacteria bacterium]
MTKRFSPLRDAALAVATALLLLGGLASQAAAQPAIQIPSQVEPGRIRPLPEVPPIPNLDFHIETPRKSPVPLAVEEVAFELKGIEIVGATVFAPDSFRALYEKYLGKTVHLSDIITVADEIEAQYRKAGFVLSRAYVPPQSVNNGIFQIVVVEGYVAAATVEGGDSSTRARVDALLDPVLKERPLQVASLERALLEANELPGVTASGLLRPSPDHAGASDLVVTVVGRSDVTTVSLDNRGSVFTNPLTLTLDTLLFSPVGDGGQLHLDAAGSPDFVQRRSLEGRYFHALADTGVTLSLGAVVANGEPGASLSAAHILTDSVAVGPRASYALFVSRSDRLTVEGGFTWQSADVDALGTPLSHDEWRVLDLALTYQQKGFLDGSSSATVGIAQGLPGLGATRPGDPSLSVFGARTDFTKLTMAASRLQALGGDFSLALSGSGQYAFDTLVEGEEVAYGGSNIGRGYDPAVVAGDNGIGGSLELRYDQRFTELPPLHSAQFYAFYDVAAVWSHHGSFTSQLASTGFGVRTAWIGNTRLGVEFAHSLDSVPGNDNGHIGARILFNASIQF